MPATESTWRDQLRLNLLFGLSGVALLLVTLFMFYADHYRSWKRLQPVAVNVETFYTQARKEQYETDAALAEHEQLSNALRAVETGPLDHALVEEFKAALASRGDATSVLNEIDNKVKDYDAKAAEVATARAAYEAAKAKQDDKATEAAEVELRAKEDAAIAARNSLIRDTLKREVNQAKIDEDKQLNDRKIKSGELDAVRATYDLGVRDNAPDLAERAAKTKRHEAIVAEATARYQELSAHRRKLEGIVKQLTAPVDAARKALEDNQAALRALETAYNARRETYVNWYYDLVPLPGKKVLNLPILDAFGTTRKIDNLWSEGLEQDYNFRKVRRYDRCTTCHSLMTKTLPGKPTDPAYPQEREIELEIAPLTSATPSPDKETLPKQLERLLGLKLANEGAVSRDDVTILYVRPSSPAAKAELVTGALPNTLESGEAIREGEAAFVEPQGVTEAPGLMLGDVIAGVNGQKVFGAGRVSQLLVDAAIAKKPIRVTVKRGLPQPFASHPRLDLYLSDSSPHAIGTFACTVCHEGQGSATDFRWASHTPNTKSQADEWRTQKGWFDNHHWIFPMYAKRFSEASCLKCHHDVVELEASERFPDAPAPKVVHGYQLIRKYGCYGCHEVNGYDGPTRRVGPDLRSEPSYFAVAQGLQEQLRYDLRQHVDSDLNKFLEANGQKAIPADENITIADRIARMSAGVKAIDAELIKKKADLVAKMDEEALKQFNEGQKSFIDFRSRWNTLEDVADLAAKVVAQPGVDEPRHELKRILEEDAAKQASGGAALTPALHRLANFFKDTEAPGSLRRPGPSLRYAAAKLDDTFLNDWIANPKNFRPNTRMPVFFGLWDHLKDHHGEMEDPHAPKLEPIEVRGLSAYIKAQSQTFIPIPREKGISESTEEEQVARGKTAFEVRGCLACHTHDDFKDANKYRKPDDIVQGPDLTGVGTKFSKDRNPLGPEWLYSWIKEPTRYHARTVMPNLFLNPEKDGDKTFDPAADIVAYLLASKRDWKPDAVVTGDMDGNAKAALDDLTLQNLKEAVFEVRAADFLERGIPDDLEGEFKGVERELLVPRADYDAKKQLSDEQKLRYIGRKSVAKYGCFGCHDVPGFEDAKPIGTGLADWGRKDPAKLAFEHITHYIEHGHGHAKLTREEEETEEFYKLGLESGHRQGFIYQKLKEPRSYDFKKTEFKRYNERLRMPQFPFSVEEREAVITFVLGLVADPPRPKYVFTPNERQEAILQGKVILEKYNCGGCHVLDAERWELSFPAGKFGPQSEKIDYPFVPHKFAAKDLEAAGKPDTAGRVRSRVDVLPDLVKETAYPYIVDEEDEIIADDEKYLPEQLTYLENLFKPAIVDGAPYQVGVMPLKIQGVDIERRYPAHGGDLTRYLLPRVLELEQQVNRNASGKEAWGWLPPPLMGEGRKVQTDWLHDFLLNPYPIRPAVFLRMPKFNMSSEEAGKLAAYFAAVDNASYPYEYAGRREEKHLADKDQEYQARLKAAGVSNPDDDARFSDAMKMITDSSLCVKCHLVGDFMPQGSNRAKAPNLADVYRRMRPDYVRQWIANPVSILPYTSMPVNIPYKPDQPHLGGVKQELYHGTSEQQVDALVDLLMNFDQYTRRQAKIADKVPAPPPPAEADADKKPE